MTRPTRQGGFRARSPARIRDWGLGPASSTQVLSASGKTIWSTGTTPGQNLTVIRTRGLVNVTLINATGAGDGIFGAHGIYMMTEDAFLIGVTAALDPLTDANSDMWLWHSYFNVSQVMATEGDGQNAMAGYSNIVIDSKAMRKGFDPERVMVGMTGTRVVGTASARMQAETRQLFLS